MKDLQKEARFMHDQLEEIYHEITYNKNVVINHQQDKFQKYLVVCASIILALIILIA